MTSKLLRFFVACVLIALGVQGAAADGNRDRMLTVMTRNMDLGSDLGYIMQADNNIALVIAIGATFEEVIASDIPGRAQALAGEIDAVRPDIVSLQEVGTVRTGPYPGPATTIVADQLDLLMTALDDRGLHYKALVVQKNLDMSLPAFGPSGPFSVGLADYDVMLARSDLPVSQFKVERKQSGHYAATLPFTIGETTISVPRGWIAVDVKLRGKVYRVVDTHLETFYAPIQAAQAIELLDGPLDTTLPVILAADLNSDASQPSDPNGPAYALIAAEGFVDVWTAVHASDPGFTWPLFQEDPPFGTTSANPQRIDLVMTKGAVDPVTAVLTGTTAPYASDHAGVAASFVVLP